MNRFKFFIWLIFITGAIISGIVTGSIWIGLIIFFAFLAINKGFDYDYFIQEREYRLYMVKVMIGLVLMGAASWMDKLQSRWLWTPIWMLAAITLLAAAVFMHRKVPRWSSILAFTASGLSAIFAIVSPYIRYGYGMLTLKSFLLWLLVWLVLFFVALTILVARKGTINDPRILTFAFILLFSISIISGVATGKYWIGLMILMAFWLLYKDTFKISKRAVMKYKKFLFYQYTGLLLILAASWLDRLQGEWIWTPIWILTGLPFFHIQSYFLEASENSEFNMKGMASTALMTSILCLFFGISIPKMAHHMPVGDVFLVWLFLAPGFVFLMFASSEGLDKKAGRFIFYALAGTIFLAAAVMYSQFAGGWIWRFFSVIGAILIGIGALGAYLDLKIIGFLGGILSVLYVLIAIFGSTYSKNFIQRLRVNFSSWGIYLIIIFVVIILSVGIRWLMIKKIEKSSILSPKEMSQLRHVFFKHQDQKDDSEEAD